ncbi:MAG: CHRD domain-containing protein [Gemmatimonadaceae bacterium]
MLNMRIAVAGVYVSRRCAFTHEEARMVGIKRWSRTIGVVATLALVAGRADAQTWTSNLNGPNESPANSSPGTGQAVLSLNGSNLTVNMTFTNLLAGTTASHLHCCTPVPFAGTAVVATVVPSFTGFPLGVTSGSYTHIFDLMLASSYNPAFLAANGNDAATAMASLVNGMNSGQVYLNIHTTAFPGGEIRGFTTTTPEPGTLLLLGTGLPVLSVAVRKRRAAREG